VPSGRESAPGGAQTGYGERGRFDSAGPFGYGEAAMTASVFLSAPAKVNLHLDVLGRRADGYHDILSLFQAVSLADELHLRATGRQGEIRLSAMAECPPEQNLVMRAVRSFRRMTGSNDGVEALVVKRIPLAAGFGGGSSDAAAVLRAMAALFQLTVPPEDLLRGAAELGSDVPFFLGAAAALVEGRGERITPLPPRLDYGIAAVFCGVRVSTAEAYRILDEHPNGQPPVPREEILRMYAAAPVHEWAFSNSFTRTVCDRHPACARARDALREGGALAARLTGSGSTVIGLFPDQPSAARCADGLAAAGHAAACLNPLATIPDLCYYE
jgi:4-diphosphocytidyl-2-C-methyl-D-erythritol kinase